MCVTRHVLAAQERTNTRCSARAVQEAKKADALELSLCGRRLLASPHDTVMHRLLGFGLPRTRWLRYVAAVAHIAGISAALSEVVQFGVADCEWGDFALSFPSPAAHDIFRAMSYWLCIVALFLNIASLQAQLASMVIRTPHTIFVIGLSALWVTSLGLLWSGELERSLLLDFPRYVCHALMWPIVSMSDALPPKVRIFVLRYFCLAASLPMFGIAVSLRLPRASFAPGNERLRVIGMIFPSALELMSMCSVLLGLLLLEGVWRAWVHSDELAYPRIFTSLLWVKAEVPPPTLSPVPVEVPTCCDHCADWRIVGDPDHITGWATTMLDEFIERLGHDLQLERQAVARESRRLDGRLEKMLGILERHRVGLCVNFLDAILDGTSLRAIEVASVWRTLQMQRDLRVREGRSSERMGNRRCVVRPRSSSCDNDATKLATLKLILPLAVPAVKLVTLPRSKEPPGRSRFFPAVLDEVYVEVEPSEFDFQERLCPQGETLCGMPPLLETTQLAHELPTLRRSCSEPVLSPAGNSARTAACAIIGRLGRAALPPSLHEDRELQDAAHCVATAADSVVFFVRQGNEFKLCTALLEHDLALAMCGRTAVRVLNRCLGIVLVASISAATSEGAHFLLSDCEWGDFPLAYPTSAWHDIWRSLSYWVGLLCLLLVLLSLQRTLAALAIRTIDFATAVVFSLLWAAGLALLWSWDMERSLLLDFPRIAVHALVWPTFLVADSFHPRVRMAVLRFFGPVACAVLLAIAAVLRLPASDRNPRNRTFTTWGVQRIGLFDTLAFCALSLALLVLQGVWTIWRNPRRMAFISQAVPFRTASVAVWSRVRESANLEAIRLKSKRRLNLSTTATVSSSIAARP
jgi:hypothetical protein